MKLTVELPYITAPDEHLRLRVTSDCARSFDMAESLPGVWRVEIDAQPGRRVEYAFEVADADGTTIRKEWNMPHRIFATDGSTDIVVHDHWRDCPADSTLFASAFTEAVLRRPLPRSQVSDPSGRFWELQVFCPQVRADQVLAVTGSSTQLGKWDVGHALTLSDADYPLWRLRLPLDSTAETAEYKFLIINKKDGSIDRWEKRNNRIVCPMSDATSMVEAGLRFEDDDFRWHGAGTVIPVFSLRSHHGFGIGDFGDLLKMTDWVWETGQNVLQILPVNDTTTNGSRLDSYPYNAISTLALHPVYLNLDDVGDWHSLPDAGKYEACRQRVNKPDRVDYESSMKCKTEVAQGLFHRQGESDMSNSSYHKFAEANSDWLDSYAAFCVLRDKHKSADMRSWGDAANYSTTLVDKVISTNRGKADFYRWMQYHLHRQLRKVTTHARSLGIVLKGDLPIGISRCSVEAWQYPELFNLNQCAGAPPDDFATDGQNWGFPTYNWERMAQDGYRWWKRRFGKMAEYFDAYRIDHLLGFFRIWQIPRNQSSGLLGSFYPALPMNAEEMENSYGFHFSEGQALDPTVSNADTNVLFVPDSTRPGTYHPRIEGYKTQKFSELPVEQQQAYRWLHNDFFYNRHNEFWRESAMKKLPPLLQSTGMLACGEDLGMIPACVKPVMEELKILSLEIQQMPKIYGHRWGDTSAYPYLSVAATSTHDMPGLRLWLRNNADIATGLLKSLGHEPESEDDVKEAKPQLCQAILEAHLLSPSMLCILPWQDWMSIDGRLRRKDASDETINNPACSTHYWRYRMHIAIEDLLNHKELTKHIKQLSALRHCAIS